MTMHDFNLARKVQAYYVPRGERKPNTCQFNNYQTTGKGRIKFKNPTKGRKQVTSYIEKLTKQQDQVLFSQL